MLIKQRLLSMVCLIVLSACSETKQEAIQSIPSVKYITASEQEAKQIRSLSGKIDSSSQAELSFGVSGKVTRILVNEGDAVFAGQLLAELDKKTYQLLLDSALSKLKAARASLTEAELEFNRKQVLVNRKLVAISALDSAKNKFKSAQSQVAIEEKNIAEARNNIEKPG